MHKQQLSADDIGDYLCEHGGLAEILADHKGDFSARVIINPNPGDAQYAILLRVPAGTELRSQDAVVVSGYKVPVIVRADYVQPKRLDLLE